MARAQAVAQSFRVAAQQTLAATHAALVRTAKREHARVMNTDPRPRSFTRIVDGVQGRPEEAVRPYGVIVYRYPRIEMVAQAALDMLFDESPVLSGEFRQSHQLYLNGQAVANLAGFRDGDEVAISTMVPYARKIELGKMKMRVPGTDRVYQRVRRKLRARFSQLVEIDYTFRAIADGRQIDQTAASKAAGTFLPKRNDKGRFVKTGTRAHNKPELRYPTIIIRER